MENKHPNEFGPHKAAAEEKKDMEKASKGHNLTYFAHSRSNPADNAATGQSTSTARATDITEGMIQATLQQALEGIWPINDPRAKAMTFKILEMIAIDNRPFSMVRDMGFSRLVHYVKPRYNIPSRSYFVGTVLPKMYDHVVNVIQEAVNCAVAISLTSDGWRAKNKEEFMSLTAHCVFSDFKAQSLVLHTKPFTASHTAVNINNMLNSMIDDFKIPVHKIHNIVHDNASNMTLAMVGMSNFNSLPCFIHTTQLVVNDGILLQPSVNTIMAKTKKMGMHLSQSMPAARRLTEIQVDLGKPKLKYIQEVATRWDSEFLSLERVRDMKPELSLWLIDVSIFLTCYKISL